MSLRKLFCSCNSTKTSNLHPPILFYFIIIKKKKGRICFFLSSPKIKMIRVLSAVPEDPELQNPIRILSKPNIFTNLTPLAPESSRAISWPDPNSQLNTGCTHTNHLSLRIQRLVKIVGPAMKVGPAQTINVGGEIE